MCITVGTLRKAFDVANPNQTPNPLPAVGDVFAPAVDTKVKIPFFVITYGIEGLTQQISIDLHPEQTIAVPASFVRVVAYNFVSHLIPETGASSPIEVWASVTRAVGKVPSAARSSESWQLSAGNLRSFWTPPFARRFFVSRNKIGRAHV